MTGKEVIALRDHLKTERSRMESHWEDLAPIFTPFRKIGQPLPDVIAASEIFDSTARHSAEVYSNGISSLIVPREDVWVELVPPKALAKDDEAVTWCREASETFREELDASNFYEEFQQSMTESPVFGTCSLWCGEMDEERGELVFLHQPIGTYYLTEDAKGRVDGHVRDFELTPDQAAGEFGEESLPQKIRDKVGKPAGRTERFKFIHAVVKRRPSEIAAVNADVPESAKRPFLDITVEEETATVVRNEGAYEFPFAAHRFRRYGSTVWGFGPGYMALGDARQASFLNELADLATEKEVFPPLLAAASLEGEIAQGALEVTYVEQNTGENVGNALRELHSGGRMSTLQWRLEAKQAAIERAFYVDLFKLFSRRVQERGPLTATEASLVAGEKLTQFSPVYGRIMSEMVDPVVRRVFGVLLRNGRLGKPPQSMVEGATGRVVMPAITYRNRIALAMKAKENGALIQFFELMLPVLQTFPQMAGTVWNALEGKTAVRDLLRNSGTPERWIASLKTIEDRERAQAEAAAQRAALENAELATKTAGNLGKAPPAMLEQFRPPAA